MRLDKFLVATGVCTRSEAKNYIKKGMITVNGKVVKPSKELKIGDEITIEFGNKSVTVRVSSLEVSTKKADAVHMYEFVSETPKNQI